MSLDEAREAFLKLFFGFREDAVHWTPSECGEANVFVRRAFVRSTIALVESAAFAMKQLALATHEAGEARLADSDLAVLRIQAYDLDDTGKVKPRKLKLRTLPNCRFAVYVFIRAHELGVQPLYDGVGWQALRSAVKIRDRLVHPKSPSDLEVSDQDVEIVNQAARWVDRTNTALSLEMADHSRSEILRLMHQGLFDSRHDDAV